MLQHGTIHDSLCSAFSLGLFAAYELESERPERLIGKSDEELIDEYYGTKEPDVIQ